MDPKQQKIERLKAMGLPIPLDKEELQQTVNQTTVKVKDPRMLDRINQIKNGGAKREFQEILEKVEPIKENKNVNVHPKTNINQTRLPKPENQNGVKPPALASFQAAPLPSDLAGLDDMFESNSRPRAIESSGALGRNIQENTDSDYSGNEFIYKLKSRLQKKVENPTPQVINESSIDMKLLEQKMYKISESVAQVIAEEMIEKVLDKFLNKKQNLNENKNTFKKYKNNIIEIEGQFYKLTPIKVKQN